MMFVSWRRGSQLQLCCLLWYSWVGQNVALLTRPYPWLSWEQVFQSVPPRPLPPPSGGGAHLALPTSPHTPAVAGRAIQKGSEVSSHRKHFFKAGMAIRPNQQQQRQQAAAEENIIVLIDVENVRGKSGFALSHSDLLEALWEWSHVFQPLHMACIVDHGSEPTAMWLPDCQMSVLFAGPQEKADDVICRELSSLANVPTAAAGQHCRIVVVTADQGLIGRCRRAAKHLQIVSPLHLLEDFEQLNEQRILLRQDMLAMEAEKHETTLFEPETLPSSSNHNTTTTTSSLTPIADAELEWMTNQMDHEIQLGSELLSLQAQLRLLSHGRKSSNKRKKKLQYRVNKMQERLSKTPKMLERVTDILQNGRKSSFLQGLSLEQQTKLLKQWERVMKRSTRKETTGDRVVLAENLRRQLLQEYDQHVESGMGEGVQEEHEKNASHFITRTHAYQLQARHDAEKTARMMSGRHTSTTSSRIYDMVTKVDASRVLADANDNNLASSAPVADPLSSSSMSLPIRIVVLSDTHGHEHALTSHGKSLPQGDVLLHLGDFAKDGTAKKPHLKTFDEWLAQQSYKKKIILRGNHDPTSMVFHKATDAVYITKPTQMILGDFDDEENNNIVLALMPYVSRVTKNMLPKRCDIVASHVPPKNVLDKCCTGQRAGSVSLRRGLERMRQQNAPSLFLCGHIHEARGSLSYTFSSPGENKINDHDKSTLCVNTAQANPGAAVRIEHGPTVLEIGMDKSVSIINMDSWLSSSASSSSSSSKDEPAIPSKVVFPGEESRETMGRKRQELLLAIDLGLRTGLSLYDEKGRLLRYENFHFSSLSDLEAQAFRLLQKWELYANTDNIRKQSSHEPADETHEERLLMDTITASKTTTAAAVLQEQTYAITRLAMEGGDLSIRQVWQDAMEQLVQLRNDDDKNDVYYYHVRPEDWRSDLLIDKEKQNSGTAKAASRLIARQVVANYGIMPRHEGKFKTDVAEAVVMGYHVTRRLGWTKTASSTSSSSSSLTDRDSRPRPAVQRYSNGGIVVPKP